MILVRNVSLINGEETDLRIPSQVRLEIEGKGLHALPACIDPHVHFRSPGHEKKETWITGAHAALAGGVTRVFDMPNNQPTCTNQKAFLEKDRMIKDLLSSHDLPLQYKLYWGAEKRKSEECLDFKDQICGIKIFMGSSTGPLLVDDDKTLREFFKLAAEHNILVAIHAEDEATIQRNTQSFALCKDPQTHSLVRSPLAASKAIKRALNLVREYGTKLYILHISSILEMEVIKEAKKEGLPVFCEASPHHLFLNDYAYQSLGCRAQVNPPLRTVEDQKALWQYLLEGVIDTIGSDHAPHLLKEKKQEYGKAPSGVPGVETTLPLLLNAYNQERISLRRIVELSSQKIEEIFHLEKGNDWVLVDLHKKQNVSYERLKTKCCWSPYEGWSLQGWPIYTIASGKIFYVNTNHKTVQELRTQDQAQHLSQEYSCYAHI